MKPTRIFIIRHGQSEGNVDKTVYNHTPDYAVNLTPTGKTQAIEAGVKIKSIIGDETVGFYVSPYYRARQTYQGLITSLTPSFTKEDPRLREHEWAAKLIGDSKLQEEKSADHFGVFYYRFNHGESGADVYDRLSTFLETLHRDFKKPDYPKNIVIVGHGMANRIFLMRWFHLTVEQFELLANPKNGEYYILELQKNGKYELSEKPRQYPSRRSAF